MAGQCDIDDLEALVQGRLGATRAAAVREHAAGCPSCREELRWLEREQAAMAARRAHSRPLSPALWQGVAERIARPAATPSLPSRPEVSRRLRWVRGASAVACAAAAVTVFWVTWRDFGGRPHGSLLPDAGPPAAALSPGRRSPAAARAEAERTLDQAEDEYRQAVALLEASYREHRGKLSPTVAARYDRVLSSSREQVSGARLVAGNDLDGRMVVLDGYAEYLRSLQTIVTEVER